MAKCGPERTAQGQIPLWQATEGSGNQAARHSRQVAYPGNIENRYTIWHETDFKDEC